MILDTDVLIHLIRANPVATAWLNSLPELPAICGFAAMELVAGSQTAMELQQVKKFLSVFPLVWPSEEDLKRALTDYMPLRLSHGIGLIDCLIATTAVGRSEPLGTFNLRHFRAIPGLITIQPYTG